MRFSAQSAGLNIALPVAPVSRPTSPSSATHPQSATSHSQPYLTPKPHLLTVYHPPILIPQPNIATADTSAPEGGLLVSPAAKASIP